MTSYIYGYSDWWCYRHSIADFNGDRVADHLEIKPDGNLSVALSTTETFSGFPAVQPWRQLGDGDVTRYRVADFDGDGKADVLFIGKDGSQKVTLSTGTTFAEATPWIPNGNSLTGASEPSRYIYADFNGDGKLESLFIGNSGNLTVTLPNGTSFTPLQLGDGTPAKYFCGDFNGDGKADIFFLWGGIYVALSTGTGFSDPLTWLSYFGNNNPAYYRVYDFNGDGKADILFAYIDNTTFYYTVRTLSVALSTGSSFLTQPVQLGNLTNYNTEGSMGCIRFLDITGDGKMDIYGFCGYDEYIYGQYYEDMLLSSVDKEDLLVGVSNGMGGHTGINYALYKDSNTSKGIGPLFVVDEIINCDNYTTACAGNSSSTKYSYANAYYHTAEHDFRGFNYAKVTGPAGPVGEQKITETWFHQGSDLAVIPETATAADLKTLASDATGYMKGKPYRTRVSAIKNATSPLITYGEVETTYTDRSPDPTHGYYFNPPSSVDTYSCAGGVTPPCKGKGSADARQSETVYADYDEYGNVLTENQSGDITDSTDDRIITRSFAYNRDAWIVGLPATETVSSPDATKTYASTNYYYDDASDRIASATNQTPSKGNLTRLERVNVGGTNSETWVVYDDYGNPVMTRDGNSNIAKIDYDSTFTFPTKTTSPPVDAKPLGLQTITRYYGVDGVPADYGRYGQVKSVTDPNGAETDYLYDFFGRQTKATRLVDGSTTSWSYNNFGTFGNQNVRTEVRTDTSTLLLWSEEYFDGLGRTFKKKSSGPDAKKIVNETQYDKRGAVTQSSLPYFEGIETARYVTYTYDPIGRVSQAKMPRPTTNDPVERVLTCYDEGITGTIDPNNHLKKESRDVNGRLRKVEEYTGTSTSCEDTGNAHLYATTTYQYDQMGNLTNVEDTKHNQAIIHYDTLGRKTDMSDPDMGLWHYQYDGNGNLTLQTDAKGQKIKFGYDALNRLKTKDYGADSTSEITFTYDEPATGYYNTGHLTTMGDLSGSTKYLYDQLGRTYANVKYVGGGEKYVTSMTYDDLDRIKTLTYPKNVDNETVEYIYDTGGNLSTVTGHNYDNSGSLLNSTAYATYVGYNALGQPLNVTFGNGVKTKYAYYPSNNRLQTLTTASPTAVPLVNLTYSYYNNGNILSITDGVNTTVPHNVTGASYSLFPGKAHAFGITGTNFQYDVNGNMTMNGTKAIDYNYDNMPVSIYQSTKSKDHIIGGSAVSFVYDGNGSRVQKAVSALYAVTYIDKLYECTSGSIGQSCGKYIFAGDTRIALKNTSGTYYYHPNHLGSTVVVTDASGARVDAVYYHPFGETAETPVPPNTGFNHKYTGQEEDSETGLYNYNARLYSPETGRFITADSMIPDPENPQSLNRYSYVLNNPLSYTDPTGNEFTAFDGFKIGFAIFSAYFGYTFDLNSISTGIGNVFTSISEWAAPVANVAAVTSAGAISYEYMGGSQGGMGGGGSNGGSGGGNNSLGYKITRSETFIRFGEVIRASQLNAALTGYDFRGKEFSGFGRVEQFGLFLTAAPSPALKGSPYHPESVTARIRPSYRANPAHDLHSPSFNMRKTPEPADAASVYQDALRAGMGSWYGRGKDGWYRYSHDNAGGVHFSGTVTEGRVPIDIRRRIGGL